MCDEPNCKCAGWSDNPWKKNVCRECFHLRASHGKLDIADGASSSQSEGLSCVETCDPLVEPKPNPEPNTEKIRSDLRAQRQREIERVKKIPLVRPHSEGIREEEIARSQNSEEVDWGGASCHDSCPAQG